MIAQPARSAEASVLTEGIERALLLAAESERCRSVGIRQRKQYGQRRSRKHNERDQGLNFRFRPNKLSFSY